MKIKTDFVTNSSSSSFIVFWPIKIKSEAEVSKWIKRADFVPIITQDALEQKARKASPTNKSLIKDVAEELEYIYDGDYDTRTSMSDRFCQRHNVSKEDFNKNPQWRDQMWQEDRLERNQRAIEKAIDLLKKHEGEYVYFFHYADEDGGIYAELEHNNNWGGLPATRISKH